MGDHTNTMFEPDTEPHGDRSDTPRSPSGPRRLLALGQRALVLAGILLLGTATLTTLAGIAHNRLRIDSLRRLRAHSSAPMRALPPYRDTAVALGVAGTGGRASPATGTEEGELIGSLRIPRLGIEVAILEGTDGATLRQGVGHIAGTAFPGQGGNVGIAGHRDGFFRPLRHLRVGDRIEIDTVRETFVYRADTVEVVDPDAVRVLEGRPGRDLTLVTCYPFYYLGFAPSRYVVHAHLVTSPSRDEIREIEAWRRAALSPSR